MSSQLIVSEKKDSALKTAYEMMASPPLKTSVKCKRIAQHLYWWKQAMVATLRYGEDNFGEEFKGFNLSSN